MPSARITTAATAKVGLARSWRKAQRRSCTRPHTRLWKTFCTSSSCSSRSTSFSTSVAWSSGSSTGVCGMYSDSAEIGVMPRSSSAFCSWPKSANAQRMTSCGSPFSPVALAHLLEPVVDQLELERVGVEPAGLRRKTPMRLNRKATLPVVPRLPPPLLKCVRTLATVRVGLSVAVSTRTATPCGRVALVEDLLVARRVLARGALDRRLDLVLRHVDGARVLDRRGAAAGCRRGRGRRP